MIFSRIYINAIIYFKLYEDFLSKKINGETLQKTYLCQSEKDMREDEQIGRTRDYYKKMKSSLKGKDLMIEKLAKILYEKVWSNESIEYLNAYEVKIQEIDGKGELFFIGIWDFLEEYIREYHPTDDPLFDPETCVGEKELEEKVRAAYEVLKRNKHRWLNVPLEDEVDYDGDPVFITD